MSAQVDAAFQSLLTHGSELVRELKRAERRIDPALKIRLDGFDGALSQAQEVAKYARPAAEDLNSGGVFDGGPASNPPKAPEPKSPEEEEFDAGFQIAKLGGKLPEDASDAMKHGFDNFVATREPAAKGGEVSPVLT